MKNYLFYSLILSILLLFGSCSQEDSQFTENQKTVDIVMPTHKASNDKFHFVVDPETGGIITMVPVEILGYIVEDWKMTNEFQKIKKLQNTYNFKNGKLKAKAIASNVFKNHDISIHRSATPSPTFRADVQNLGWLPYGGYGDIIGTTGQNLGMEQLELKNWNSSQIEIIGRAHLGNIGWESWAYGTTGILGQNGEQMQAVQLVKSTTVYKNYYRAHVSGLGWLAFQPPYGVAGTTGQNRQMEAIQIIRVLV